MSSKNNITSTKEEEKSALVPKLRFPEFLSAGNWTTEKLGAVATISSAKVGSNVCVPMSITSGVGLVSQEDKFGRVIAGDSYKNYLLLKPNDFAYNKSATKEYPEGFLTLYSGTKLAAVPNSIFTCFRINCESPNVRFLNYQFSGNLHGRWLRQFIQVGARANGSLSINDNDLMALPVPIPAGATSVAEQQKIADCLSSVDELIAAQARKLGTLKIHKTGLMQQLFPCKGETQPRLRFPGFQKAGEWARMSIQEMIDQQFIVGHLDGNHGELYPKAEEFTQSKDGIPYITANDFVSGIVEFAKCKRLPIERARLFKKGVAKNGDILFAHNATVGPVAKLSTTDEFVILSTTATYFRCDAKHLSNDFLKYALSSPYFVSQYSRVMSQSTRNQVPITTQRKLELQLPELPEQECIAACLSSFDTLIAAETQKLEAFKTHKNGLMRQLFPCLEEEK